jgi:FtsZ family, C-terminal domain
MADEYARHSEFSDGNISGRPTKNQVLFAIERGFSLRAASGPSEATLADRRVRTKGRLGNMRPCGRAGRIDFADVRAVMRQMGKAMMGTGEASGEKRAMSAAEAAISNPVIDEVSIKGAKGLLISITGGKDVASEN